MKTALTVAVTFALALGTASLVAQTAGTPRAPAPPAATSPPPPAAPPNNMPAPGTTPPPSATGVTSAPGAMPPSGTSQATRPGSPTGMLAPDYNTLDRTGAGFITQRDASGNPWLSQRFTTCDTDHNGQVSRAEYTSCSTRP